MSLADARTEVSNAVYRATFLIESLENYGRIYGIGHHARQNIVAFAVEELEQRWIGEDKKQ